MLPRLIFSSRTSDLVPGDKLMPMSYERCASCNAEPNWFTSLTQIAGVATAAAAAASPYRTGKETRVIGCPVIGDVWGGVDQLSWDEARGPPSFYNREKYGHKPLHEAFYIVMCLDMQERDSLAQALEGLLRGRGAFG